MPDINLVNLNGIPGLSQVTMIQANDNDCGAYAIIAAVGAHRGFPMISNLAYNSPGPQLVNVNAVTAIADTYPQLSAHVYSITGILNNAGNMMPVVPELLAAGNVYNSPAAMAQVAMNLGRQVSINVQEAGFIALNALYPNEKCRCEAIVGPGNVNVAAGNYAAPGPQETHVVCVKTEEGFHWLASGSNGDFYDPADGTLNNNWNPVNTNDPMGMQYVFTGLWMEIR